MADRGELSLAVNGDDDLIHLYYKNRESGAVEDDLIVFPGGRASIAFWPPWLIVQTQNL